LTVFYLTVTVLYLALTVLYLALTALYLAVTALYLALTVLYVPRVAVLQRPEAAGQTLEPYTLNLHPKLSTPKPETPYLKTELSNRNPTSQILDP